MQPLVDGASAVIKAGLNKFAENIKKLISKYNDFLDKLEFNINHSDVVINNTLSKIFGREILIKMPFLDTLRAYFGTFDIRKGELVGGIFDGYHINDSDNEESGIVVYNSGSTSSESNNAVMAIFQGIVAAIEFDWLNKLLEFFGSGLEELSKEASIILVTTFNTIIDYFKNSLVLDFGISSEGEFLNKAEKATNGGGDLVDGKGIGRGFGGFAAALKFLIDIDSAGEGIYTKTEDIILATISLAASILLICVPQISFVWGLIITASSDIIPDIILLLKYGYIAPVRINKDE